MVQCTPQHVLQRIGNLLMREAELFQRLVILSNDSFKRFRSPKMSALASIRRNLNHQVENHPLSGSIIPRVARREGDVGAGRE